MEIPRTKRPGQLLVHALVSRLSGLLAKGLGERSLTLLNLLGLLADGANCTATRQDTIHTLGALLR